MSTTSRSSPRCGARCRRFPEIYARVMQEFGQAISPRRTWDYDRIKLVVCAFAGISEWGLAAKLFGIG